MEGIAVAGTRPLVIDRLRVIRLHDRPVAALDGVALMPIPHKPPRIRQQRLRGIGVAFEQDLRASGTVLAGEIGEQLPIARRLRVRFEGRRHIERAVVRTIPPLIHQIVGIRAEVAGMTQHDIFIEDVVRKHCLDRAAVARAPVDFDDVQGHRGTAHGRIVVLRDRHPTDLRIVRHGRIEEGAIRDQRAADAQVAGVFCDTGICDRHRHPVLEPVGRDPERVARDPGLQAHRVGPCTVKSGIQAVGIARQQVQGLNRRAPRRILGKAEQLLFFRQSQNVGLQHIDRSGGSGQCGVRIALFVQETLDLQDAGDRIITHAFLQRGGQILKCVTPLILAGFTGRRA
ncbi:MAG: hypothetical protein BWX70_00308 [Verrucomicrobia bacterium ADurb.Bin070]|nr:MAG: hypothetical protein BWX70_00308 [Verrucomicrobia bacterium ADurb.Bin070]